VNGSKYIYFSHPIARNIFYACGRICPYFDVIPRPQLIEGREVISLLGFGNLYNSYIIGNIYTTYTNSFEARAIVLLIKTL